MAESCGNRKVYAEGEVDIRNNELLLSGGRPIIMADDDEEDG
jgi:hypothetical protein